MRAYLQAGKTAEALTTPANSLQHTSKIVQLHFTLGVLLASAKQYKPAQLELEQANALKPETLRFSITSGRPISENTNTRKPISPSTAR